MNTFDQWLQMQTDRNDPIGDFARDAQHDTGFPVSQDYFAYRDHLGAKGASSAALRAFNQAWREWRAQQ